MIRTSEAPPESDLLRRYVQLSDENKELKKANQLYEKANREISRELNETRLRLAKAEEQIEKLTRISVEVIVE